MRINIASNEVVHFIGIGGIGMSGLAQIMHNMGFTIQGSDLSKNKNTDKYSIVHFLASLHHLAICAVREDWVPIRSLFAFLLEMHTVFLLAVKVFSTKQAVPHGGIQFLMELVKNSC